MDSTSIPGWIETQVRKHAVYGGDRGQHDGVIPLFPKTLNRLMPCVDEDTRVPVMHCERSLTLADRWRTYWHSIRPKVPKALSISCSRANVEACCSPE